MARPEGMVHFIPPGQEEIQRFISSAANQSVRPYSTNEEYLYAMKEDLAEWFKELYRVNIHVDNFIAFLQNGVLLCEHANRVNEQAKEFRQLHRGDPMLKKIILPSKSVPFNPGRHASSFFARDNVANFIDWCRKELLIAEAVMFESNDLILRKNEKNFILCLLEVARRGSKFGVPAPVLIQMEEEIDEEIEQDLRDERSMDSGESEEEVEIPREPPKQKVACDFKSLDEMVQYILGMCSCPTQFPMVKVSEGKYKVGDSKTLIFMRILRNHVMVRVGGGWDTLEHYLDKHDPCRCNRHKVEQKIAARSSRSSQGISVKQANDIFNKAGPGRNSESSQKRDDWSDVKSQNLPGFTREVSTPRSSKAVSRYSESGRSSKSTGRRSESTNQNHLLRSFDAVDGPAFDELTVDIVTPRRSVSPAPNRRPKALSRFSESSVDIVTPQRSVSPAPSRRSKALSRFSESRVSKSMEKGDPMNHSSELRNSTTKSSNLRTSKTLTSASETKVSPRTSTLRSKTPTPGSLRSSSSNSMGLYHEPRRSVTPTPTVTSQRRAEMNRAKSPDPDKMLRTSTENKRSSRAKGPPSAYRGSETLPRNHRPMEKAPSRQTTTSVTSRNSSTADKKYNSLPRPSSSKTDSGRRSALSLSNSKDHHRSLQDVRQPPRPKSALGTYSSTTNLSTVPKTSGRKTIANPSTTSEAMQRLSSKARSQSMDNLSIQRKFNSSLSATKQRNQFFDRLSQPKATPKNRTRTNLVDENVLLVERKSEGRHNVQRNSMQRPSSPNVNSRSREDRSRFIREGSTSSEASSHSAQPITPTDLNLRLRRGENDKKGYRSQNSLPLSTPSPSRDSALGSLRLSVSMTGSPESPTSRVSYALTPDSGGDELDSPISGHHPSHTPKIINRQNQGSHLKAPPKKKVSKEEVLHVVRNPDGQHQWEHTDKSLEQSQEYVELCPYKDQLSPRSSQGERTSRSSTRKVSSESESSVFSPGGPNTRISTAQITLGKPARSSTPNRLNVAAELKVSNMRRKQGAGSTSSSSIASSKSSQGGSWRGSNITEQVRSMLFAEDGKRIPPSSNSSRPSNTPSQQHSAMKQRPTTPKNEISPRLTSSRSQPRPTTPKNVVRSTTPRPRPKTPEIRRGTLTRQEKMKSYDGPSSPKKQDPPEPRDKETRMLREMEREYSENQKILAASASGDSEDAGSLNDSLDYRTPVEYDYNGRRIRKKPMRSKSPSNLRSRSAPRMDRMQSGDSELTNRSYDRADSMADSEDFEVAMAMSGGAKHSAPTTIRSRSVDDFLDERGPRPRKDKHDSRKSRIPTPVHFNSGRKSATGVPYHDSNMSKSALRSNVEGVGTYELNLSNHRKGQGSLDNTRGGREQERRGREKIKDMDDRRNQPITTNRPEREKENIQPQPTRENSRIAQAEEYDLDNQECFKFGRYGNNKNKQPRNVTENPRSNEFRAADDFIDRRQPYFHKEDITAGYVENQYLHKGRMLDSNVNNNNNNSNLIGLQPDQSEEPIPPPRKKGGYHRSTLHTSPADMLKANKSENVGAATERRQDQQFPRQQPQDRNDSGIEAGTDPDSPGSSSAMSMRSAVNGDASYGTKSGSSGSSVFSPRASQQWDQQQQSLNQVARSHVTAQKHGVVETSGGTYYYVRPGQHNSKLNTGYDAPRQGPSLHYQSDQAVTGYPTNPSNQLPNQSPKPAFYPNQYNHSGNSKTPQYSYPNQPTSSLVNQSPNQAAGSYQSYGSTTYPKFSSSHSTVGGSRQASVPAEKDNRPSQHPTTYDREQLKEAHNQSRQPSLESQSTRISKRRNFNDFFTENRKLKDSLNNLNKLYDDDSRGSSHQIEGTRIDDRSHNSVVPSSNDNRYESPSNSRPAKKTSSYTSSGPHHAVSSSPAQIGKGNSQGYYYTSSTFPRSSRKHGNNNSSPYPNMGMDQYPQDDAAPAPPPRYKSQQKAYERQVMENPNSKYHYATGPENRGFPFANGHDLRQGNDERQEEYV